MVVIVILGILAALVVPRVLERPDEARIGGGENRHRRRSCRRCKLLSASTTSAIPTVGAGPGRAGDARPDDQPPLPPNWKPNGYLDKLRNDPWGRPYQYLNPGLKGEVDVYSLGADGKRGGTGTDADVGSWDL